MKGAEERVLVQDPSNRVRQEAKSIEDARTNLVKVFAVTKARDREGLGQRITDWLQTRPSVTILKTEVRLSSDREFHCLSFVLFGHEQVSPAK